nr:DEAD/DEAH box helicase [Kiritimatiellia bacterium]
VTATADRGDKRNLGEVFEHVAFEYHLPDAITDGYLAPIRALTIPLRIEVGHEGAGDITPEEASNALEPYLHQIADHIRAECVTRKTVCFLPLIDISRRFAGMLAERGITAREVNGESPDRAQVLRWFDAAGPGTVLCNAMLLTEGWDCISVDCICPLRPTKIRSLYAQMVGRGTRLAPGKRDLLLLDFLWQSRRLPLCRPAHLVCDEEPEVMARVAELLAERAVAGPVDIVTDGAGTALEERERALARILEEQRKRKRELVDPLQYERSIGVRCDDAGDLRPPTIDQKKALQAAGIYPDEITSRTHAAEILSALQLRQWQGAATPKQIRALERYGFQDVGRWPKSEAAKVFCILAKNRWALPNYLHPATYRPAKMVEGVAK